MQKFVFTLNFLVVIFLLMQCAAPETDENTDRLYLIAFGDTAEITASRLNASANAKTIEIFDPQYQKMKSYRAVKFKSMISNFGAVEMDAQIQVSALDGYRSSFSAALLNQSNLRAFLAFADKDSEPGWELLKQGKEMVSPAPFYLVWQKSAAADSTVKLPWPYQIKEIKIVPETGQIESASIRPPDNAPQLAGFKLFKQHCISCHSVNKTGGGLGPELNVPKNISEYWAIEDIRGFIKNPAKYRWGSKMPAFERIISDEQVEQIIEYLLWLKADQ